MSRLLSVAALLFLAACTPEPSIDAFTASAASVPYGGKVTLTWTVRNARTVELEPAGPIIGSSAQVEVRGPTTFVLVARGEGTREVRSAPVTVTTTPRLEAVGGIYNSGAEGLAVTLFVADADGSPPQSPFTVTLVDGTKSLTTGTCAAGSTVCVVRALSVPPLGAVYQVAFEAFGAAHKLPVFAPKSAVMAQPAPVVVTELSATQLRATWPSTIGALEYRAQAFDRDSEELLGDPVITPVPEVTVTLPAAMAADRRYGVWVEAINIPFEAAELPSARVGGIIGRGVGGLNAPGEYTLYSPAQFDTDGTLTATLPALKAHERVAALVFNLDRTVVGRDDHGDATFPNDDLGVQISAAGARTPFGFDAPQTGASLFAASTTNPHRGELHGRILELNARSPDRVRRSAQPSASFAGAPVLLAAPPANRSFCVISIDADAFVRKEATLVHETATAAFYVDNEDLSDFLSPADLWNRLGESWESAIWPRTTSVFGNASDVDNNGKIFVLFSRELGDGGARGIIVGYFIDYDVVDPIDTSPGCTDTASNGGDILYMNTIANLAGTGRSRDEIINTMIPGTVAHELQHLINQEQRCPSGGATCTEEAVFINEGLSMVAEDLTGFGWGLASERVYGGRYLDRFPGAAESYVNSSLTIWSGDPIGNYQGSKSFFRYLWDRFGEGRISSIAQSAVGGIANIEKQTGVLFDQLMIDWGTALTFSNEPFAPTSVASFDGVWAPLHANVGYVNWIGVDDTPWALSMRINGWAAFMTGPGTGADVTVTVKSQSATHRPSVALVRYTGVLPRCSDTQTCVP